MAYQIDKVDLTIPIFPQMEYIALETAAAVGAFAGLDEWQIEETQLALIEACVNAFEHSQSKDKNVYISFFLGNEKLVITVRDYGKGFNRSSVKIPKIKDKLKSSYKRGWGLHLMNLLMDRITIKSSNQGTIITMVKNCKNNYDMN